jgi:prepilin-type N-terminal cleavage/methylation domain-containing protein/prepilin-type processing-associated H-X9-DG protein
MSKRFTLIELLVVIAIIGILSSMLLPALSSARLKTQQAVCLSNQRQISTATFSYIYDNNSYAPAESSSSDKWYLKLVPTYLVDSQNNEAIPVYSCPNARALDARWESTIAMNIFITGKHNSGMDLNGVSLSKATATETVMLMDAYTKWYGANNWNMIESKLTTPPVEDRIAKHQLKANVTYLDGSAKAKSTSFLLSKNDRLDTFWDPEQ